MNQGFKTYFGEGMQTSKRTLKKKGNLIKFYFLWIISFLGNLSIIFAPVVSLVKTRLAYRANLSEDIYVYDALRKSDSIKQNWTNFVFAFTKGLLLLAGIVLIGIIGGLAFGFGYVLTKKGQDDFMLGTLLSIPFGVIMFIYIIVFWIYFAPSKYLLNYSQDLTNSKVLYNSVNTMRNGGKWTYFMLNFVYGLLIFLYLGITSFIITMMMLNQEYIVIVFGYILLIIFVIVFLAIYPRLSLARACSLYRLYDDIIEVDFECECATSMETASYVSRKRNSKDKNKFIAANKEQILVSLFKETKADKGKKNNDILANFKDNTKFKVTELSDEEKDINFDNAENIKIERLSEIDKKTYDNDFSDNAPNVELNFAQENSMLEEKSKITANSFEVPKQMKKQLYKDRQSETSIFNDKANANSEKKYNSEDIDVIGGREPQTMSNNKNNLKMTKTSIDNNE